MTLGEIEQYLRYLASKFSGVEMSHHLDPDYKGSARSVGITWVDEKGNDIAIEDTLLELADQIAMIDSPIEVK